MVNFIQPLPIECLSYTSWPLKSSKEIPPFIEDVTERTCSHSSLGCVEIRARISRHFLSYIGLSLRQTTN